MGVTKLEIRSCLLSFEVKPVIRPKIILSMACLSGCFCLLSWIFRMNVESLACFCPALLFLSSNICSLFCIDVQTKSLLCSAQFCHQPALDTYLIVILLANVTRELHFCQHTLPLSTPASHFFTEHSTPKDSDLHKPLNHYTLQGNDNMYSLIYLFFSKTCIILAAVMFNIF